MAVLSYPAVVEAMLKQRDHHSYTIPDRGQPIVENAEDVTIAMGAKFDPMGKVTLSPRDLPPADEINALWEAFDHCETEASAWWILKFCQERGHWGPFTRKEIQKFQKANGMNERFQFNRLIEPGYCNRGPWDRYLTGGGWVVEAGDHCYLTEDFIRRLYVATRS